MEFQIRRPILKQFKIDSLTDLVERSGGLWRYLTDEWFSVRMQDDTNTTRRSEHGWWLAVQEAGQDFGQQLQITRNYAKGGKAQADWYVSHAGGCLLGYAARQGISNIESASGELSKQIGRYWAGRDFTSRYKKERIKLGFDDEQQGGGPCQ